MGRKWYFAFFILLFVVSAVAFAYDVNSETISREKITSTETEILENDIGIELEKQLKEGDSFTSTTTIPIANIDSVDRQMKLWAIEQEDLFFKEVEKIDPPLSKYAEAHFTIEPIVKEVKKDFLTYEMHVQFYIEDNFNDIQDHFTKVVGFVIHKKEKQFVQLEDVINIPKIKNKSEFTRFLSTIPDGKEKETLQSIDTKTIEPLEWLINDKSIEFLIENDEEKNKVDRTFVEFKKIEKHLTDSYKKKFVPKKKAKKKKQAQKKRKSKKKETDKKLIALTFDDGPDPIVTPSILNTLEHYDIKATFFMLARNVKSNVEIAKQVAEQGHEIANHSETHINLNTVKRSRIEQEVIESKNTIKKMTGVTPKLFRPPYGEYNSTVIDLAKKSDQEIIMWSVDTLDWKHKNKNKTVNLAMERSQSQSIILMHDIHQPTADALPNLIESLQKEGYEFVTISELLTYLEPASNGVYYGR